MTLGTSKNPIKISSAKDLYLIGDENYNDCNFVLTEDLYFNKINKIYSFLPDTLINTPPYEKFKGHIDGQDHIIHNLHIKRDSELDKAGIISNNQGTIKNLHLNNVKVSGKKIVGSIAAVNEGKIKSCYVRGECDGDYLVGGISGFNYDTGKIISCVSESKVKGKDTVGGIVGKGSADIIKCFSCGSVTGSLDRVGGIAGRNSLGTIRKCASSSDVNGLRITQGGLVGYNNSTIRDSYFNGDINNSSKEINENYNNSGMIAGNNAGTIKNCYWNKKGSYNKKRNLVGLISDGEVDTTGKRKNLGKIKKSILIGKI